MNATTNEQMSVNAEELELLAELLDEARTKLLVEIRRTYARSFREQLRRRLTLVEGLLARCQTA